MVLFIERIDRDGEIIFTFIHPYVFVFVLIFHGLSLILLWLMPWRWIIIIYLIPGFVFLLFGIVLDKKQTPVSNKVTGFSVFEILINSCLTAGYPGGPPISPGGPPFKSGGGPPTAPSAKRATHFI